MSFLINKKPLKGTIKVPGDKSLAHRAILLAACATDEDYSIITGVPCSADVLTTISAIQQLGAEVIREEVSSANEVEVSSPSLTLRIKGWGERGPFSDSELESPIDCGNSATLARLLMGLLIGYRGSYTLTGDESLVRRPMERVSQPLGLMGGEFKFLAHSGCLPLTIKSPAKVKPQKIEMAVASAQVKSAILLAATSAEGITEILEPYKTRNHTENLLRYLGANVSKKSPLTIAGPFTPQPFAYAIPGDPSSAAFFATASALIPESDIKFEGLSLNPTRLAFFDVIKRMGVKVDIESAVSIPALNEPYGNLHIYRPQDSLPLTSISISAASVPLLIDEIPLISLLAAFAEGESVIYNIGELRVKESDRVEGILSLLDLLKISVWIDGEDLHICGKGNFSVENDVNFDCKGDHRMAMLAMIAARCISPHAYIKGKECVNISYPDFDHFIMEI